MGEEGVGVGGRLAQALVLASAALAPWAYGCAPDTWRYALAALLLLAGALWWSSRAARDRGAAALWPVAMGLPAVAALQIALRTTSSPLLTAEALLQTVACLGGVCVLADLARERRGALVVAGVLLAAAGAQAAFAVVQSSLAPKTIYGVAPSVAQMPFGSYVNHNHFAGLIAMVTPLALGWSLGLLRSRRAPTPGVVALAGLGLGLALVGLASRSRGGLLALLTGVVALGLLWWQRHRDARRRSRVALPIAAAACATALAFAWFALPRDAREHLMTVTRGRAEASGSYRLDTAIATVHLAGSRPWMGAGLGTYADAVTAFKRDHGDVRTTHAENDILQLPAETGLLGVLACCGLILVLARRARMLVAEHGDPVRRGVALGALAGVLALLVHSFMDFNLHVPANALAFGAVLALSAVPARPRVVWGGRAFAWVAGLCASLLVIASLASAWRSYGARALEQADRIRAPHERVARLGDVVRLHPYLADARYERARANMVLAASGSLAPQRLDRAEQDLRAALRLRPLWGEAWADLAWDLALRGDRASARAALDRALALDPTHRGIRWLGSLLQTRDPQPAEDLK